MALVDRNGRMYLYRSARRNGRVTSEYCGSGVGAVMMARLEQVKQDEADYQRWRQREERRRHDEIDRELDELTARALDLARKALEAAGYHQHKRGEWRRRRVH